MTRLRWINIPIPPQHLVGLLLGTTLQIRFSQRMFSLPWIGHVLGWPLIVAGIWISVRAAVEAGEMSIESPTELLTTGLYSHSRNPMYIGWTLLYLGIALAANSIWIIALLPIIFVYTHFVDIRKEEEQLKAEFGNLYLEYQDRIRRYL
jgi:protein-S-isoprenylcysteine O-methyltransferase Ste14